MHVHSRKVELNCTGVEGGGACVNSKKTSVEHFVIKILKDVGMEVPKSVRKHPCSKTG